MYLVRHYVTVDTVRGPSSVPFRLVRHVPDFLDPEGEMVNVKLSAP